MGNRKFQVGNLPGQVRRFNLDSEQDGCSSDGAARVAQVLAELSVVLKELRAAASPCAESSHRLFIHIGRLSRLDPAYLPLPTNPTDLLEDAETCARETPACLISAADPKRIAAWKDLWLKNAEELARSYEDFTDPDTRATLAQTLLASLDEMDLLRHAARRLNNPQCHLDEAVTTCANWLSNNANYVVAAEEYVRRELETMRRDLPVIDRELTSTITKFLQVSNAIDEMELSLDGMGREIEEEKGTGRMNVGTGNRMGKR
jgi:hypothetical protein